MTTPSPGEREALPYKAVPNLFLGRRIYPRPPGTGHCSRLLVEIARLNYTTISVPRKLEVSIPNCLPQSRDVVITMAKHAGASEH
jgi:hypothetical protein